MQYTVNFEGSDGEIVSWSGGADDEQHAVDVAREEANCDGPVIDVFEEV